jgi:transcriptional regulator with XRE-family HTH domain
MGRRLASARVRIGLSQEEAASQAETTQAYLSLLENDKAPAPRLTTVAKLADAYGVSIDFLVKGAA